MKYVIGLTSEATIFKKVLSIPLVVDNPDSDNPKVAEFDSESEARVWAMTNEGYFDEHLFDWEVFEIDGRLLGE